MKTFFLGLLLSLSVFCSPAQAHSIPPALLEFMVNNPDATNAELQAFIDQSGLGDSTEVWGDETSNQTGFNLPTTLVNFLLENPDANEPEILAFMQADPELAESDWVDKIEQLLSGYQDTENPLFTMNDLVLLNQLGQTFDQVYDPSELNWWRFARNYIGLGIEHILIGLDHILFVMSLVLLLPPWRRVLMMVTTFTLAHSLTLILGGTNFLTLSGKIVEPIIAASIAYMAITTVFLSKKYPWFAQAHTNLGVIFLFGLFHGLGFAGVFADVAPEASRLLPSLLFFNIGVEIGQILILALFMPFLWALKHFKLDRYFVPVFAVVISVLALWWVVTRVFF